MKPKNRKDRKDRTAKAAGPKRIGNLRSGVKVWTMSNGGRILCTVIKPDLLFKGEWLLDSPAHGYAIQRHRSECEIA